MTVATACASNAAWTSSRRDCARCQRPSAAPRARKSSSTAPRLAAETERGRGGLAHAAPRSTDGRLVAGPLEHDLAPRALPDGDVAPLRRPAIVGDDAIAAGRELGEEPRPFHAGRQDLGAALIEDRHADVGEVRTVASRGDQLQVVAAVALERLPLLFADAARADR